MTANQLRFDIGQAVYYRQRYGTASVDLKARVIRTYPNRVRIALIGSKTHHVVSYASIRPRREES